MRHLKIKSWMDSRLLIAWKQLHNKWWWRRKFNNVTKADDRCLHISSFKLLPSLCLCPASCKLRKSVLEASAGYLSEFQCKSQNEDWNVQKVWKISRTQVSFEVWSSWLLSHQTTNSSKNIGLYPEWFLIRFLYFCYCVGLLLGSIFSESLFISSDFHTFINFKKKKNPICVHQFVLLVRSMS